ncbi:MAG: hypothetical protein ACYDCK_08200 [Thermoplasmatota archaeon]
MRPVSRVALAVALVAVTASTALVASRDARGACAGAVRLGMGIEACAGPGRSAMDPRAFECASLTVYAGPGDALVDEGGCLP